MGREVWPERDGEGGVARERWGEGCGQREGVMVLLSPD